MIQWYELLFANYGKTYDKECFTQGTAGEVDFVEQDWELIGRNGFWTSVAAQADIPSSLPNGAIR